MSTRRAAEYPKLVLQANDVDVGKVQEVGRSPIGGYFLLLNFEADLGRIIISALDIVDRHYDALDVGMLARHRVAQIERKSGNATFARQVVSHEGDLANF